MAIARWKVITGATVLTAALALGALPALAEDPPPDSSTEAPTTEASTTTTPTTAAPTTAPTTAPVVTTPPPPPPPPPTVPPPPQGIFVLSSGARGPKVAALQWRLLTLGFWLSGVDSKYGGTTVQAVMAFQKHYGLRRSGNVDQATANLLNQPLSRVASPGRAGGNMFEVDKGTQVGYLIRNGRVEWAVNVSTGSGKNYREFSAKLHKWLSGKAVTPEGSFRIYREKPNGWWEGELGRMYRPKYIYGGVAVHGSGNVPSYPASHGCIRVSTSFMDVVWGFNLMPRGSVVWVHG